MQVIFQNTGYSPDMAETISHLRRLREASGLSVRELARQIGQQPSNVSFWETTDKLPRSEVLIPMSRALGISVEELLGANPKRNGTAGGRLGKTTERITQLPRRQQGKILDVVEAMLAQEESKAS
jgi:transcriptional regulator with XRE-family HTH domain